VNGRQSYYKPQPGNQGFSTWRAALLATSHIIFASSIVIVIPWESSFCEWM